MEDRKLKRIRTKNFTTEEKELFSGLIDKYWPTLSNKNNITKTRFAKMQAWEDITEQYNKVVDLPRTVDQLKALHKQRMLEVRKTQRQGRGSDATGSSEIADEDFEDELDVQSFLEEIDPIDIESKKIKIEEDNEECLSSSSFEGFRGASLGQNKIVEAEMKLYEERMRTLVSIAECREREHKAKMEYMNAKIEFLKEKRKIMEALKRFK